MARKIAVLQGNSEIPKTYIKKSVAALLVRRLLAVWVIDNLTIRRTAVRDAIPAGRFTAPRSYIPSKMPWAELPGVKFVDPISKTATQNQAVKRRFFVMAANRIASL